MNILVLAHRIPFPPNKGEKIRTFHQIKYLHELGHQITVVCPFDDVKDPEYAKALQSRYCQQAHGEKLGSKYPRLLSGLLRGQALSVANFYQATLQTKVDALLQQNPDAVLCTASSMAAYIFNSSVYPSLKKPPRLYMDFMDLDSDKWRQYAAKASGLKRWIFSREARLVGNFEKRIAEQFSACFFITETECQMFRQQNGDIGQIYAVENGLDTDAFHPPLQASNHDKPVFLFTGVMDYAPNIDAALWFVDNVWQSIRSRWPNAEFIIAGMNPSAKIQSFHQKDGVLVTGFVDDILPYYHQATIFVAPFRIARGVQNKILQAFACGLPVVTTPMGAEGIKCADGFSILIAESPQQFFAQIERLIVDAEHHRKITEQALHVIDSQYKWEALLDPMVNVLQGCHPTSKQS